ncbi:hypothetical protein [Actinophytocola sp.]|uniref:hypothetical protein n=1 Tax=Actinophytocola sp. TaxID=1872138 RepID=UPI002EDA12A8
MDKVSDEVDDLAAGSGFGAFVRTVSFGGAGARGCFLSWLAAALLLLIGVILLVTYESVVGKAIGAVLAVTGAALAITGVRFLRRTRAAAPRAHLFAGGLVFVAGGRLTPYPWPDLVMTTRIETQLVGQAMTQRQFARLELHTRDGDLLLSVGEAHIPPIAATARAGGVTEPGTLDMGLP